MTTQQKPDYRRGRWVFGLFCLLLAVVLWLPGSDVIELIVRQRPVLLGRYSQGHFGALLVVSMMLAGVSLLAFSRIRSLRETLGVFALTFFSTILTIVLVVVGSGWLLGEARYVETAVRGHTIELEGMVRHRPPDQFFEFVNRDVPEQHRSYPDPPPGYPDIDIELTTDRNGFRNRQVRDSYPIVAVGDSFVAGSHVSDNQGWSVLLAQSLGRDIYNLGVSGSNPQTYLNNFSVLGTQFNPELAVFMLYEGNDFKPFKRGDGAKEQTLARQLKLWSKASPVTRGLKRFSREVLETAGADRPVPGYAQTVGWMPVAVAAGGQEARYYAFQPKRLLYLNTSTAQFSASSNWRDVAGILDKMQELARERAFHLLLVYAPSKPHVVMPLVEGVIPADQLRNFAGFKNPDLPPAEQFKTQFFANIDAQEQVFTAFCQQRGFDCLSLTAPLQRATAAGQQTYFTYDQHWTPLGNAVVADAIQQHVQARANALKTTVDIQERL